MTPAFGLYLSTIEFTLNAQLPYSNVSKPKSLPIGITCSVLSGLYILNKALSCRELSLKQVDDIEAMSSAEIFGASSKCAA